MVHNFPRYLVDLHHPKIRIIFQHFPLNLNFIFKNHYYAKKPIKAPNSLLHHKYLFNHLIFFGYLMEQIFNLLKKNFIVQ
jgi:hypothetical protein